MGRRPLALLLLAVLAAPAQAQSDILKEARRRASAQGSASGSARPAESSGDRTWALIVGVLEWQEAASYAPFKKDKRRDAELVAHLKSIGVPERNIVFLSDREAVKSRIEASLESLLAQTKRGDSLLVYYAGHGVKDDDGSVYFAPHDANAGGRSLKESGWKVGALIDAIESGFKGQQALLAADCCHSGALVHEARARGKRVRYGLLGSSQASATSTGQWTFTQALLDSLRGAPGADYDGDGRVLFSEMGRYAKDEMTYAEGQMPAVEAVNGYRNDELIAAATRPGRPADRARAQYRWKDGNWYPARVVETREGVAKVRWYDDSGEDWISASNTRAFQPEPSLDPAQSWEVEWKGKWYPARILGYHQGVHHIRYDGYTAEWDEWVSRKRLRPRAP